MSPFLPREPHLDDPLSNAMTHICEPDHSPISCSATNLPSPTSNRRVIVTALHPDNSARFIRKVMEMIDTTVRTQSNTADDVSGEITRPQWAEWRSEDSQASDPSTTVSEVDLSTSTSSTAVESASPTLSPSSTLPLLATSLSMTTVLTSSPLSSPSFTVTYSGSPTSSDSTASSAVNNLVSPPSSAYTTGIYIALGIFLFFGILCALVTSPAIANAVKGLFRRGGRATEQ
ncbi:hypothetical protein Z517_02511 [Fonsecaea pedrosoi CBS 271.37]|uniref:Uncharacterized protein n=1 Tax=Fonsecaea pedrosoi CBS 271.37 TaxID=1442368 RepID=A0A0D2DZM9_9EURO|nr:uncharacterized protein Z517_02511 [Fonsecaea pedrosoi CBS 271.37]KIW83266.1 hypothetical protein Z517_02511 [Fonsecaea pedrosoi CBS 271.37]